MRPRTTEHLAYSIQDLGSAWRWRIHGAGGHVLHHGLEPTRQAAEACALARFCRESKSRPAVTPRALRQTAYSSAGSPPV